MKLISAAFRNGKKIPRKYTGEGENISPAFVFEDVPKDAKELVLICHDPDAPRIFDGHIGFSHWVLYDIPPSTTKLEENVKGFKRGINDAKKLGYTGPMPPVKHGKHHYFFTLIALKKKMNLDKDLSMTEVLKAIESSVIAVARVVGTYKRNRK